MVLDPRRCFSYQGIWRRSRKKQPLGPLPGSVAAHSGVSAASSTVREPELFLDVADQLSYTLLVGYVELSDAHVAVHALRGDPSPRRESRGSS